VLAALRHRDRTGEGQRIEVAMVETMRAFVLVEHGAAMIPVPATGPAGHQRILTPNRRPQQTADGWIHVMPYSRKNYDDLFLHAGRADLLDHRLVDNATRLVNSGSLYQDVAEVMATDTTAGWLAFCREHDIPATAMATLDEMVGELPVVEHPVAGPYHQVPPGVHFDVTPMTVRREAPLIGADGDEVLAEVGYTVDQIAGLRAGGALRGGT
jgi:crotonobetainyl-CoA:carnitine CoA-transferase CaiB-like acyl-CoA transferase